MTDVPGYMFLIVSCAVVLGVVITVRGALMFRAVPAAAAGGAGIDATTGSSPTGDAGDGTQAPVPGDADPASTPTVDRRDLKEPMVMTLAGAIITIMAVFALRALISFG